MFRPMLAPQEDPLSYPRFFEELEFPVYCSPKIDGIRCVVKEKKCMSRSFKPLRSLQVQEEFHLLEHVDGELIEGNITDHDVYNRTQSHVMSSDKPGEISYHLFDYTHPSWLSAPFSERLKKLISLAHELNLPNVFVVPQIIVSSVDELLAVEETFLQYGYEGVMGKAVEGPYKCGRGTWREQLIWKLKRFKDDEGIVRGFRPRMHNENEATKDALGYTERSSHKDNKTAMPIVGVFEVEWNGMMLDIAPGAFKHDELVAIWNNPTRYVGQRLKFRYMSHGIKDKPRHPRAVGWRSVEDYDG